jgi:hypothetical protein
MSPCALSTPLAYRLPDEEGDRFLREDRLHARTG